MAPCSSIAPSYSALPRLSLFATCLFLAVVPVGCEPVAAQNESIQIPSVEMAASPLRPVHVLVGAKIDRFRIRSGAAISLAAAGDAAPVPLAAEKWYEGARLANGSHVSIQGATRTLPVRFEAESGAPLQLASSGTGGTTVARWYPGAIVLQRGAQGTLEIVNEVDVEQYVASVVAVELPAGFDRETRRVGAIVARTFVLDQMHRRNRSGYDVGNGQESQVYRGVAPTPVGHLAQRAAADTSGLVCTWRDAAGDHLFPTYYSAVCGGISQSAAMFGQRDDVPPLRGGVLCDFCKIAPKTAYRWGPVEMPLSEVYERLAPKISRMASLGRIVGLRVSKRTKLGRPLQIRVTGSSGASVTIPAERFRLALGPMEVRSTQFDMSVEGSTLVLSHGRGFGHGLGLCQWGAEGKARSGKKAGEILRYYYPGARITRVY